MSHVDSIVSSATSTESVSGKSAKILPLEKRFKNMLEKNQNTSENIWHLTLDVTQDDPGFSKKIVKIF